MSVRSRVTAKYENSNTSCYVPFSQYNHQKGGVTPPIPDNIVSYVYVVPTWKYKLGYDTLVKQPGTERYPKVESAYAMNDGNECEPNYIDQPCV